MAKWIVGDGGYYSDRLYQPGDIIERPDDWKPKPGMVRFDPSAPPAPKPEAPDDTPKTFSEMQRGRKPRRAADAEPI